MTKIDQNHCQLISHSFAEHNDCTVRAVAIAAQVDYAKAHHAMKVEGRRNRCGAYPRQYFDALKKMGMMLTDRTFHSCTARTIAQQFPRGTFLVQVSRHVFCMRDGVIHDWAAGRLKRVKQVTECVNPNEMPSTAHLMVPPPPAPVVKPNPMVPKATIQVEWFRFAITVADVARMCGVTETQARGLIDGLRRKGHKIVNIRRNTYMIEQGQVI